MDAESSTPDRRVAEIAAREHAIVDLPRLAAAGLGRGAIQHRVRTGRLYLVHPGVYAVGHPNLSIRGKWLAGVRACGDGALLSHSCATALWGLTKPRPRQAIEVTTAELGRRGPTEVRLHRSRSVHQEDRAIRDRIPVTSPSRTLVDMAARLDEDELLKLFETTIRLRLLNPAALARLLGRSSGRKGTAALRILLRDHLHDPDDTKSILEDELAAFCRKRKIRVPAFNVWVGEHLVDALWAKEKLVAELDSKTFHGDWSARERDTVRDADLLVMGYRPIRITSSRLRNEPDELEAHIRALLAQGA